MKTPISRISVWEIEEHRTSVMVVRGGKEYRVYSNLTRASRARLDVIQKRYSVRPTVSFHPDTYITMHFDN